MTGLGLIYTQPGHRHLGEVCAAHGVTRDQLTRADKSWPIVAARHDLMFRLCVIEKWGKPKVGRFLRKDPQTVYHGVRKYAAQHIGTSPRATLTQIRAAWIASRSEHGQITQGRAAA
jgi:hypothetical protein